MPMAEGSVTIGWSLLTGGSHTFSWRLQKLQTLGVGWSLFSVGSAQTHPVRVLTVETRGPMNVEDRPTLFNLEVR